MHNKTRVSKVLDVSVFKKYLNVVDLINIQSIVIFWLSQVSIDSQ